MPDDRRHTLELVARHLIRAAHPLIEAGASRGAFMRLMSRLGFFASDLPAPYAQLATTVSDAATALETLSRPPSFQDLAGLLEKAKAVHDAIQGLGAAPAPTGADAAAYAEEIGERLFELLLTDYLAAEQPGAYSVLSMLNVISIESIPATATRPSHVRTHFRWDELPRIVSDPQGLPARVYGWGGPDFDDGLVLEHLAAIGLALRLPVQYRTGDSEALGGYLGLTDMFPPTAGRSLVLPFFYATVAGRTIEGALALQRLPAQDGAMPGLILEPRLPSEMPLEFRLGPSVQIKIRAGTNVGQLFGITLRPPDQVGLRYPLAPDTPPPAAGVGVGLTYSPAAPLTLVGDPAASRIELASLAAGLAVDVVGTEISLGLTADLLGLKLVIAPREGDSLLRTIVGDTPVTVDVPLGIEWRKGTGIRFKGSAAFAVTLHPHLQLGPVRVDDATVKVTAAADDTPTVRLELGVGMSGRLGPLQFLLEGIGVDTDVAFGPGNAGPFDIALGFKPPNGAGLAIDAAGFTGGGFLVLDREKGEYSGGLELLFEETIAVAAIGIVTTRMPDGREGFSLLVVIVADTPPIQLPFGFTLRGVGGLLALNRAADREALRAGLTDGSLDSVLFPKDVVANAARILGDLQRVFPVQPGRFLVGPMADVTWGAPPLVRLKIGVILELPRPGFVVLGVLRAALPAEDAAILFLQVNFVGTVDFESGQIQFDATLYDSRVLNFTLTGDLAVRFYWKKNANLLLTAGGFNPTYTPPPMNLGQLARLNIVLSEGNPDIRAEAYFAVTSNTLQFGARLELAYTFSIFSVQGFLSLDVLIMRSPFHFVAEIAGMIAVRTGGHVLFSIRLELRLDGPLPLRARGSGSFEIGFVFTVTIRVRFDVTIRPGLPAALAPIDVLAELAKAIADLAGWRPRLPHGSSQSVTLRTLPGPGEMLVLHPYGFLEVSQKLTPLGIPIQLFGSAAPARGRVFSIVDCRIGGDPAPTVPTLEEFAPAQFFEMSDAEKLSRPSFEQFDSGVAIGGDPLPHADCMRQREVSYEVVYLPERHPVRPWFDMPVDLGMFSIAGAAVSRSPMSYAVTSFSALSEQVIVERDRYAVVSTEDLSLHATDYVFDTAVAADVALKGLLAEHPELAGARQVMPAAMLQPAEA
jgi:hypothetical protein